MSEALRILIVDDDAVDRKLIKRQLAETALEVITQETASAEECLKWLRVAKVDCILLDYRLPEMNGIDFLVKLRGEGDSCGAAVVMLTGSGNERLAVQAMRLGVQDYLVKGEFETRELEEAIRHAIESAANQKAEAAENQRLEELALRDSLTRLGNRNLFNMRLDHALRRARRQEDNICLLYMDLDGFKEINDRLGHAAGDAVLFEVARRLENTARDADTVARLGGDEFAVLMETGVSDEGARRLAARIKASLSEPIVIDGQKAYIGASIGIAHFPRNADSFDSLIQAADVAMYEAKFGSRLDQDLKLKGGRR